MSEAASHSVTDLLGKWRAGDQEAFKALIPLVYQELRRIARHHLRRERPDHTLESAALVHEAYLRLIGQDSPDVADRGHFFAIAALLVIKKASWEFSGCFRPTVTMVKTAQPGC